MKAKWLWLVTAANGISIVFLILILYSITIVLSVLAPAISIVPLYVALLGSGVLSVIALVIAMRVASSAWRWVAFALNGSALVLDVAIVLVMASLACRATKQRFIIPVDYKGDVYVARMPYDPGRV